MFALFALFALFNLGVQELTIVLAFGGLVVVPMIVAIVALAQAYKTDGRHRTG